MGNNKICDKAVEEQIMSLNFLVMKHICEILLPVQHYDSELPIQTLSEALDIIIGFEIRDSEFVLGRFLKLIGFKRDPNRIAYGSGLHSDLDYLELDPLISEITERLILWWTDYSADCCKHSIVYTDLDDIFVKYGTLVSGKNNFWLEFALFDKLILTICGETFTSVYHKIIKSPFLNDANKYKFDITYSISVSIYREEDYCTVADEKIPAFTYSLPMQLITVNPESIGENLIRFIGITAKYLVRGGLSSLNRIHSLTISKNLQEIVCIPVEFDFFVSKSYEAPSPIEAAYFRSNNNWESSYSLNFSQIVVICSDSYLVKVISDSMSEKDRFAFLGGHFSSDLGL